VLGRKPGKGGEGSESWVGGEGARAGKPEKPENSQHPRGPPTLVRITCYDVHMGHQECVKFKFNEKRKTPDEACEKNGETWLSSWGETKRSEENRYNLRLSAQKVSRKKGT